MTIFAPPTQWHLRNLILTYKSWIKGRNDADFTTIVKAKLGIKLLKELEDVQSLGQFKNIPEGI